MPKIKKKSKNNKKKQNERKEKIMKITLVMAGVVLAWLCFVAVSYYCWELKYKNKIYPNVYIGEQKVSGQSYLQTLDQLDNERENFYNKGLTFVYNDEQLTVPVDYIKDASAGIIVDILEINNKSSVDKAYAIARSTDFKNNLLKKITLYFKTHKVDLDYTLNEKELVNLLENKFGEFEEPAQDANLSFNDNGDVIVLDDSQGMAFDWSEAINEVKANILSGDNEIIYLKLTTDYPTLKKSQTDDLVEEVEDLLALAPLSLEHEDDSWKIDVVTLRDWLIFSSEGVSLDTEVVNGFLETIATEIDKEVKEGKFSLEVADEKVMEINQFQQGEDGLALKLKKTITAIEESLIKQHEPRIDLVVEATEPKATPENINELGVKELLGTGHTNFSGSPYNRIQNIEKGADILNGLLLAPGETFSLITTLGHIDGENGWLPELVIKGNKTIPEYGGGLCQIGTTSFRAAMNSGLDIIERRNHSYAVSYYNYNGKAGVDATIYEPKPDFRFKNDTENYILWRTRIEGYDIYFEFWGTSDGREGSFTEPINYNYVSPPETIITEVDTLAPGEMKCSEHAHTGVSASFDYIVKRPDDTEDKYTFESVYKALPAVCDKGKEDQSSQDSQNNQKDDSSDETGTDTIDTNINVNTNTDINKKKKKN